MSSIKLFCQADLASWQGVPGLYPSARRAARAVAAGLPRPLTFSASATVLFSGNATLRRLNRAFRGVDRPTNVLSFPQFGSDELPRLAGSTKTVFLGDIALSYQIVTAEARRDAMPMGEHVSHLVIHGLLHLLGYDHVKSRDAAVMEGLERDLMKNLGLSDPYASVPKGKK
ncbi:MAG: rRNA maturation RNase YbeY [Alphaproteobacteria bacterium]|nr:rRNA maturation RNase YbeY [Alphaproteobacteria bacterium]